MNAHAPGHKALTWSSRERRVIMWLVLSVFAALLVWVAFGGYLSPEMLFNFANGLYC